MSTLYQTIIIAALAAFIILLMGKIGLRMDLRDYFDKIGIEAFAELLDCDFCLSFWACLCLTTGMLVLGYEISLIVPFCAAPISRYLL